MFSHLKALKASELIEKLQAMIEKHGDRPVFSGGGDYPEGVKDVYIEKHGNGYVPKDAFII